ncbi:latent-transforming growth factor beta-binding protein 2-like [Salminus brasiliensis]|uniref:latent-transforming growth factor beta-binding protein 2-like n=1 Tax=Salminus brasiliensis TaxID=930266 RepID=UPI003B830B29
MERLWFLLLLSLSLSLAAALVRSPRQLRTMGRGRSSVKPSPPDHQESKATYPKKLVGPHVCGGQQCCSGWAVAPGTNRCIKPDCQPPCQNRGSCSRPHTCVCRSGFQGARCEEVAPEQVYIRTGTSRVLTPVRPGSESSQRQPSRRRPTERQAIDTNTRTHTPKPQTTRLPHSPVTQVRRGSPDLSPQQSGTSRTVKRYPSSSGPITSNALPSGNGNRHGSHGYTHTQHLSSSGGQLHDSQSNAVSAAGANLTASVDRIKIIFTPMVCRRTCSGGRCYNSCERGDKTTIYSESQGPPPKSQGFRLFFCQIPCLNGGRCIGQNECWCPSNSTGKFCHLPVPTPSKATPSRRANSNGAQNGSSHSMYTLPLSNQQASMLPSLVNVHVQHPPEAEVQIHQVARVKPGQPPDGAHSVQQRSQPGNGHTNGNVNGNEHYSVHVNGQNNGHSHQRPHNRLNGYVGRCFQETVDGKCGKPLPGLTKQEDCCGSVGASWGLNKCTECPSKPAYAVIANGQVECPKGYKRMNSTHCQDINECLMPGICKHAECLNTKGSYRCTCKPGYMLDPARSHCVSDKAVSMEKASCYRSVSAGTCSLSLSMRITKQICCCSRVGKAWGPNCERCPIPDSDHFREICPAGHGYTYSRSDVQITLRELEDEEISRVESFLSQIPTYPLPDQIPLETPYHLPQIPTLTHTPYHHPQAPTLPQLPKTPEPGQPPRTAQVPHHPWTDFQPPIHVSPSLPNAEETFNVPTFTDAPPVYPDVIEVTSHLPTHLKPDSDSRDTAPINVATQSTDIDKCSLTPTICGPGQCVSVQTGYTCYCDPGYKLNGLQTTCIDVNECEDDPCGGKGHCVNTYGSYTCQCFSGFSLLMTQNKKTCQDINECAIPNKCPNSLCINTEGSFSCECKSGFTKNWRGQCEDVDECRSPNVCPGGICVNTQGSFQCQACGPGFRPAGGRCLDVNECQTAGVCANGRCVNTEGSFICTCNHGYQTTPRNNSCQDVNECLLPDVCPHGTCVNLPGSHRCSCNAGYQTNLDGKGCEDVDECAHPSLCAEGVCVNTVGSFTCTQCEVGYRLSEDRQRCEDVNECLSLFMCPNGICLNSEGSFSCMDCPTGYSVSADGERCDDIDECASPTTCPQGRCINNEGTYTCVTCSPGYRMSDDGSCEDIDECASPTTCPQGRCINNEGTYTCVTCSPGYRMSDNGTCEDIDECASPTTCPQGRCINNEGTYTCVTCSPGYRMSDNGSCEDIDECASPTTCPQGRCINNEGTYTCVTCSPGYRMSDNGSCEDIDECASPTACPHGRCINNEGTYTCVSCNLGYRMSDDGSCEDIDECASPTTCPQGRCINNEGTYTCVTCNPGYRMSDDGSCEDIDECQSPEVCPLSGCTNTEGSYSCMTCDPGYRLSSDRRTCEDVNECEDMAVCLNGHCINTAGSFHCDCPIGFELMDTDCRDVDECAVEGMCSNGQCLNTDGSYQCLCESGYRFSTDSKECEDLDECKEYSGVCGTWNCENTLGSYRCFMGCQSGFYGEDNKDCDIDECEDETICGKHGYCENTDGSYRCQCDRGYTNPPEGQGCIDVNECETSSDLCGEALCENAEGSFLCICPNENEEFDPVTSQCSPRHAELPESQGPDLPAPPSSASDEEQRKECYYNLNDANLCENVLSRNVTKQECCCTVGAGWGDNCEIHPCPLKGQAEYDWLCPHGSGILPVISSAEGFSHLQLRDADECEMFGPEICKNGLCANFYATFSCFCRNGYHYDKVRMECVDYDECKDENQCEHGTCVNTEGSFNCFCSPPLVLDSTQRRCITINSTEGAHGVIDVHTDICWQQLKHDGICSDPKVDSWTTYTECCCLYGVAWGSQCAFCPDRSSSHFAVLCNLPQRGTDSLRERPGFEYGPDVTPDGPYGPIYWDNYGPVGGDTYYSPEGHLNGDVFPDPSNGYSSREIERVPLHRPRQNQPPRRLDPYRGRNEGFEGLQAEECGILNGCENGRCVRVREGYTCDCFDGYELDLSKMACIDINECKDISDSVELCKNGVCSNTEGSYKCTCLPGFVASSKPHECIPEDQPPAPGVEGK